MTTTITGTTQTDKRRTDVAILRTDTGSVLVAPAARWFDDAQPAELRALSRVLGPALDVGCGPGRHVAALTERGVPTLGIDITTQALTHARARSVPVLERCVFESLPGTGRWRTVLLLDGNLGMGGDPVRLLSRVRELLAPDGMAIVEVEPPGADLAPCRVRFEIGDVAGPWFDWMAIDAPGLDEVCASADLEVHECWYDDGRWFAWVGR
ncbi:MAG: class I SAM-dependent methyltransferase [Acidimicrobiia bacterium]